MNIQETIEGFKCCFIKESCTNCPYNDEEQYSCFGHLIADTLWCLETYEDSFYAFDKLEEDLKAEKEKYNEAIQHCNKMENKYKTMINNFVKENEIYLTKREV